MGGRLSDKDIFEIEWGDDACVKKVVRKGGEAGDCSWRERKIGI